MSVQEQARRAPMPTVSSVAMIRTLGVIAMLSGFLVVLVYQITLPVIDENKRRAIEQAIFQVIPGAVERRDFLLGAENGSGGLNVYAGYDAEGRLAGIAAEASAQGYQDAIRLLYGYNPACECITGIKVLKMAETPGLGDKIITDANFVANFQALDASLDSAQTALAHPIITVKHGSKSQPWEIDAISGATISSKAVGKALNQSAQVVAPLVMAQRKVLEAGDE